ncbi:hypothetical protein psal_cds_493 [Pandoravirus salinus]|uniref:Uncharacterized protein n=1 Tax=Pandoravirus salinus TaxID=1349410 RepID=S4W282_9VIRU|nr:hypothetical protein psal_cds_493 [Pandoravirus salinus]AGO84280.2 hypothetical protein psal_cds_493 [Pandoravirus salinus]
MASETTTTQTPAKTGKGMKPAKVAKILEAYRATGAAWDSLAEPVQDALIQDLMRYYDRWCKCVCRACGCQSKDHMGARNGCPAIANTRPLSIVRIIDLCCDAAQEKREVSVAVRAAIASGVGPLADPAVQIQYTRPHYEAGEPEYRLKKKASTSSSASSKITRRRRQHADGDAETNAILVDGDTSSVPPTPSTSVPSTPEAVATSAPAETQVRVMAQQLATHFDSVLAETNKRNNEAIESALRLLGNEVQTLRAENQAIRAQAAQALQASSHRPDPAPAPTAAALVTSTSTLPASTVPRAAPLVSLNSQPQQRQQPQQQQKAPAQGPSTASSRSRKNIFQLPAQPRTTTPLAATAAPSPLYPTIPSRSMAPRLHSLQGRVH